MVLYFFKKMLPDASGGAESLLHLRTSPNRAGILQNPSLGWGMEENSSLSNGTGE